MMFERWAIRQKSTGYYLPESSRKRQGYTGDEPVTMESHFCPRLFAREQDAKTALTWWLKGVTSCTLHRHYDGYFGGYEYDEDWHTQKIEERNADDMEIVKLKIEEAA